MNQVKFQTLLFFGLSFLFFQCLCLEELPPTGHPDDKDADDIKVVRKSEEKAVRKQVRFSVQLQLPASQVHKLMSGQDDGQYKRLSKILADDIQKMYADQPGEQKKYELQLSSGTLRNKTAETKQGTDKGNTKLKPKNRKKKLLKKSLTPLRTHPPQGTGSSSDNITPQFPKGKKNSRRRPNPDTNAIRRNGSKRKSRKVLKTTPSVEVSTDITEVPTKKEERSLEKTPQVTSVVEGSASGIDTASEQKFNVPILTSLFRRSLTPSKNSPGDFDISLDQYLDAYSELLKIFYFFGPIFKFAADDVKEKIALLRELRKNDTESKNDNYSSLQSMFEYEFSPLGARANTAGTRENKYLLRALKFIGALIKHFKDPNTGRSMSSRAKEAYDMSLAQYHEWYVRAAVNFALLAFPSRDYALSQMNVPDNEEGVRIMEDLSRVVDDVYNEMLKLYHKYSAPT